MTDTVHLVITGNRMSKVSRVEDVHDDPETARTHRRGLLYEGKASPGSNDYVTVVEKTVRDDAPVTPDFDYRAKYRDVEDYDNTGVSEWLDTYEEAVAMIAELRDSDAFLAVDAWIQRRNADGDVEETIRDRIEDDPWENTWSHVDDPLAPEEVDEE